MPTIKRVNHRTAPAAIEAREDFKNSTGNLSGKNVKPGSHWSAGRLDQYEMQRFFADSDRIDYIVWSYATPIAWHCVDTGWYKVKQRFSPTTSTKHQSRLYLI